MQCPYLQEIVDFSREGRHSIAEAAWPLHEPIVQGR